MKIIPILFVLMLLLAPIFVFADCSRTGATVIFINGIFGNEDQAKADTKSLGKNFKNIAKRDDVIFINGFNASHAGGVEDLVRIAVQMYQGGSMDYNLTNILRQVHADLKTQKIVLVGYSQGSFYSNAAYDYLIKYGVAQNSITVYNVGTPADRVAGNGKYLTSSTDKVIESVVEGLAKIGSAKKPLPPNITLKLPDDQKNDQFGGHYFSKNYLAFAPDRIIGDIDEELNSLSANSDKKECFIQPGTGVAYWIEDTGYYFVDNVAKNPEAFATSPTSTQMASIANSLFQGIYNFGQQFASGISQVLAKSKFWGASLPSSLNQNTTNNPPTVPSVPAVQSAVSPSISSPAASTPEIISQQDQLDDIQEKLDILNQQVQALVVQQSAPTSDVGETQNKDDQNSDTTNQNTTNQNTNIAVTGGGGGSATIYPKILISEVQSASATDDKQEFVELYNPNNQEVDLTNWYLQRKTAGAPSGSSNWSTYAPSNLFSGKIISAKGYFLIARAGYYSGVADIFTDNPITNDNSFAFKNPNGEISDKLGFGNAIDPELLATQNPSIGQSIGRKVLSGPGGDPAEQDTDDNSADFELQTPTPKAQNITYTAPIIPPTTTLKNILISEIQIAGATTTKDDWVELYNPNDSEFSLKGWSIQKSGWGAGGCSVDTSFYSKNFNNEAVIPAKGFYLVVSTSAADFLKALAVSPTGMTIGWSLTGDNTVYLVKNTNKITDYKDIDIVDEVGFGKNACFSENSPAICSGSDECPPPGQSIGRKWDSLNNVEQDTDNNSVDFELQTPTPKAQNITYFSPGQSDITAPQVNFTLNATQTELAFPINFTITDPIIGTVSPSGVGSYVFRWQEDGGAWQQDISVQVNGRPTSADLTRDFKDGEDGKTYNFQVQATDIAGNISDWLPQTPVTTKIILATKILINEIQIQGADAYQDFIELYNPSDSDAFLKNYRLVKRAQGSGTDTTIKSWANDSDSKIPAKQYYLWASSTDIDYPASINADVSTKQNISSNNGVGLRYGAENTGQIIDAVGWGEFDNVLFEIKAAEKPEAGQSIQRKWDLADGKPQDTDDNSADFGLQTPTPKAQNIAYVPVDKTALESAISNATTLLAAHPVGIEVGYISQSAHDSYNNAITAAQTVNNNSSATQIEVDSAKLNLDSATATFNGVIITSADQVAAQAVITQIAALSHFAVQLSAAISDNGIITDFLLPDFGYNTTPGGCADLYWCSVIKSTNNAKGQATVGLNNITPHPYYLSSIGLWANSYGILDASRPCLSDNGTCTWWIFPPGSGTIDCVNNPANCSSEGVYYFSFNHTGTIPDTGWSINSLNLDNFQAVSEARTAYNNLTPTQQSLVTNYSMLQAAEAQMQL